MATSKLTLSDDHDTIALAKDLILEKYKNIEIPQWIKDLTIETKVDSNMDYDNVKYEYLKDRSGL